MQSPTRQDERAAAAGSSAQQGSATTPVLANYVAMPQAAQEPTSATPQAASVERETNRKFEQAQPPPTLRREIGGREGLEPTRFGDWEKSGRCIDF